MSDVWVIPVLGVVLAAAWVWQWRLERARVRYRPRHRRERGSVRSALSVWWVLTRQCRRVTVLDVLERQDAAGTCPTAVRLRGEG